MHMRKENGSILQLGNKGSLDFHARDFLCAYLFIYFISIMLSWHWRGWHCLKEIVGHVNFSQCCRLWRIVFIPILGWGNCSMHTYCLVLAVADTLVSLTVPKLRIYTGNHEPPLSQAETLLMLQWSINTSTVWAERRGLQVYKRAAIVLILCGSTIWQQDLTF